MRGRWLFKGIKFVIFAVAMAALLGYVVMRLWNGLTPGIFGWHVITFWQALGLLVLARVLFGGFRRPGGFGAGMYGRRRMIERWEAMTPEEREKFRQGMRRGCGPFRSRAPEAPGASASSPASSTTPTVGA